MSTISTASDGPITFAVSVTPNDSTVIAPAGRGLYVGVAGNVVITFSNDTDATLTNLSAGVFHPIARIKKIKATGTTATGILVGY